MYTIRKIEQIDLDIISKITELNKTLKDQRIIHYGAYFENSLIGFILALNTSDFLLITYIYTKEYYRNKGVGNDLLLKLKSKGEAINKKLCLKLNNIPNKKAIVSYFISKGFSIPTVIRRNGIIHLKTLKELFYEKRKFNTQEWLKSINGKVKIINCHTQSNEDINMLKDIKQIFDYTYLKKSNSLDIIIAILINNNLASWIIYHEIAPNVLHVEFLYTNPPYRRHSTGFNSFTFFILELTNKYNFEYISFTTVKEDDKLLSYYKYLFKESLIKIINTEISIYPIDEETQIHTSIG